MEQWLTWLPVARGQADLPLLAWSVGPSVAIDGKGSTAYVSKAIETVAGAWCICRYLERSPQAEDSIVSLLGRQSLQRQHNGLVFLGDEVITPVSLTDERSP